MNLMITKRAGSRPKAVGAPVDFLSYGTSECVLGVVLVARSSKGVCAVLLGDNDAELQADLASRFPESTILANQIAVRGDLAKVVRFIEKPAEGLDLPLDMRGTPFQRRVWEKLRAIAVGRTVSYMELARWISPLASPRAVAGACAANPIALAIPCHRVVRNNGDLAGYRWGIERKRALLQMEAAI
ncbi:cysteine methyltransferase [Rhizobium sp. UPM1132]|uniref:methylated-DNA--[protein]-cysteine S-methyltransferase n=1 Tax=Rhizobium ruizarguesonis TaxID=2081791 RepID=UPI00144588E7|nr:methylated-DNA--[protein]-cysteine S-methyltransferase [Rhizobium ruizarguesonis]NKQ69741.1 cysteine methyltransferase [Rhizobium ruizarguesonis]